MVIVLKKSALLTTLSQLCGKATLLTGLKYHNLLVKLLLLISGQVKKFQFTCFKALEKKRIQTNIFLISSRNIYVRHSVEEHLEGASYENSVYLLVFWHVMNSDISTTQYHNVNIPI